MRTTIKLDDDVFQAARSLAKQQNRTLGTVVSELARRGLRPRIGAAERGGFPIVELPKDAKPVTPEMVAAAMEDLG